VYRYSLVAVDGGSNPHRVDQLDSRSSRSATLPKQGYYSSESQYSTEPRSKVFHVRIVVINVRS